MKELLTCLIFCLGLPAMSQNALVSEGNYFEGEPYLVMDPTNSQHLVAAWMGFQFNNKVVIKSSVSTDGGDSWSTPTWQAHVNPSFSSADVSLSYAPSGSVYMAYIDYDNVNFTDGKVLVRKSVDGGLTWGNPTVAIDVSVCPNQLCIDRPWMAIDQSNGINSGTIYVTAMNANQPNLVTPPYHPYVSISTDEGQSFQTQFLDASGFLAGSTIPQPMPSPVVLADGTFTALYPSYLQSQSLLPRLIRAKSTNQGQTLSHDVAYQGTGFGTSASLVKSGPLLRANPNNANQLSYFFLSDAFGESDVTFIETSNNGLTWSSPARINQDPVGNGKIQDLIWADYASNGDLAVCWRDRRNTNGSGYSVPTEVYCTIRNNASNSWMTDFSISDQQVNHASVLEESGNDFMHVILENDTLHVIWGDVRSGNLKIYFTKRSINESSNQLTTLPSEKLVVYPNPLTSDTFLPEKFIGMDYYVLGSDGKSIASGKIDAQKMNFEQIARGTYQFLIISPTDRYEYHLIKH